MDIFDRFDEYYNTLTSGSQIVLSTVMAFSFVLVVVAFIFLVIYICSPKDSGDPYTLQGFISDKVYSPAGYRTSEHFTILVSDNAGKVWSTENQLNFSRLNVGDRVTMVFQGRKYRGKKVEPRFIGII